MSFTTVHPGSLYSNYRRPNMQAGVPGAKQTITTSQLENLVIIDEVQCATGCVQQFIWREETRRTSGSSKASKSTLCGRANNCRSLTACCGPLLNIGSPQCGEPSQSFSDWANRVCWSDLHCLVCGPYRLVLNLWSRYWSASNRRCLGKRNGRRMTFLALTWRGTPGPSHLGLQARFVGQDELGVLGRTPSPVVVLSYDLFGKILPWRYHALLLCPGMTVPSRA